MSHAEVTMIAVEAMHHFARMVIVCDARSVPTKAVAVPCPIVPRRPMGWPA